MINKPETRAVYTKITRERDTKVFWLRIGTAFVRDDGCLDVHLDAYPAHGSPIQIRPILKEEPAPEDKRKPPRCFFCRALTKPADYCFGCKSDICPECETNKPVGKHSLALDHRTTLEPSK